MLLKDLTTLTASLVSGTLFHVEKSGKAYNIDYTKLAKAIVEEYNGSTLGGSAQTVQAAIGALNSRLTNGGINSEIEYYSNTDANTQLTAGIRYYGAGCSNIPDNYMYIITLSSGKSGDTIQIGFPVTDEKIYMRHGRRTTADFSAWKKIDLVAIS
jgi:hypothetical protein